MNHSPWVQVDAFGVWLLELDFSIEDGQAIIGHSGGGDQDDTFASPSFGRTVQDYLESLRHTAAFSYRPLFIKFEKKAWGDPSYEPPAMWGPVLDSILLQVFGSGHIFGPDSLGARPWPSVPALAEKIIAWTIAEEGHEAYSSGVLFGPGRPLGLEDSFLRDECTDTSEVAAAAESANLLQWDQYQSDWTFECGLAPPNPLCVDATQGGPYEAPAPIGQPWGPCSNGDHSGHQGPVIVSAQGSFAFPYGRITDAYARALDGWTLLIRAGNYPESVTMSKVLTLRSDGGVVVIGQ